MNTICNHCKSNKIVSGVRITDLGESNIKNDLSLEIYQDPGALFFKGTTRHRLKAKVCCSCGIVETYIENPAALWNAYQKSKNS